MDKRDMASDGGAPLVSVVIPCYNAAAYLGEAIDSALRQQGASLEVIVIDDGSTDNSVDVARRFAAAIRHERRSHAGIAAARNHGVALATGRYLAFLDADDVWPDGSLAVRLEALRAHPGTECVFGAVDEFLSPDLVTDRRPRAVVTRSAQIARLAGSMLIERDAFLRVGFFDPRLTVGETLDWVARAEDAGIAMLTCGGVVLRRRIHADNTVIRERARQRDYVRALRMSLARRRLGPDRPQPVDRLDAGEAVEQS